MKLAELPWKGMSDPDDYDRVAEVELPDGTWLRVTYWGKDDNEYWVVHSRKTEGIGAIRSYTHGSRPDGLDPIEAQCAVHHILSLTQGGNDGPP